MDFCNILILGSLPYKPNAQSRAFDSYFHFWPKENLRQFFTSPHSPIKGHCSQFYQITDYRILKRNFNKSVSVGKVFKDSELNSADESELKGSSSWLYKSGKRKTPLKKLLRKVIWKKKYWCTKEFICWIEEFKPDVIFLAWSDDFYMLEIAEFISKKYNLPIVSCVGDDYFFNSHFSLSPFYWIYRTRYKKLAKRILQMKGSHIYISDKIKNKYNSYFNISGETIHVACDEINQNRPIITSASLNKMVYFGNLGYGRYKTLITFSKLINRENEDVNIDIFSNERKRNIIKKVQKNKHLAFCGSLPYSDIRNKVEDYGFVLIAEELFNKNFIRDVKYSLSTKVGDTLSYRKPIIAVGNIECGAIDYVKQTNAGFVLCSKKDILEFRLNEISTKDILEKMDVGNNLLNKEFNKNNCCLVFKRVVDSVLKMSNK